MVDKNGRGGSLHDSIHLHHHGALWFGVQKNTMNEISGLGGTRAIVGEDALDLTAEERI